MYYKESDVRDEVVAMVIISYVLRFSLGGSVGFLSAAICAMASDKN